MRGAWPCAAPRVACADGAWYDICLWGDWSSWATCVCDGRGIGTSSRSRAVLWQSQFAGSDCTLLGDESLYCSLSAGWTELGEENRAAQQLQSGARRQCDSAVVGLDVVVCTSGQAAVVLRLAEQWCGQYCCHLDSSGARADPMDLWPVWAARWSMRIPAFLSGSALLPAPHGVSDATRGVPNRREHIRAPGGHIRLR